MGETSASNTKRRAIDNASRGDLKRNKVNTARAIPAQSAQTALKDGEIDIQAFLAAREFEIAALQESMATSKAVSSSRAFQQVPRGLRRRTASHNPKRVPRRLRARAKKEMAEDNTPLVEARRRKPVTSRARLRAETARRLGILAKRKERKALKKAADAKDLKTSGEAREPPRITTRRPRPKIRRDALNEPPRPTAKYRKRQQNKTWLPTHTWHAKRARMTQPNTPLWGFSIPLTPNEKIYRPTHRAQGDRGGIIWDVSYWSSIGILGNQVGLERVLKRIGVTRESCWNSKGKKWRDGSRTWTGLLTREDKEGTRDIATATILWDPLPTTEGIQNDAQKLQRQAFVRVHPAAFHEVFAELLRLTKMENPRLHLEDLRYEIGSIELTGPASTEILTSVLTPIDNFNSTHTRLFRSIRGLTNPAALPANAVLGFSVQDPRLRRPQKAGSGPLSDDEHDSLLETIANWPAADDLLPYALLNREARHAVLDLPTQKAVNKTLGSLAPGILPKIKKADIKIPIILFASRSGSNSQAQGGWTLLAPWSCIQHFWHSMVRCPLYSGGNPRFGGLNETMQVAFERGLPWFPADFLGTNAGCEWEMASRRKRRQDWEKRPKSKRTEWSSLDLGAGRKGEIGDGFACDLEVLFSSARSKSDTTQSTVSSDAMDIDHDGDGVYNQNPDEGALLKVNTISKVDFDQLTKMPSESSAPSTSVITVRITLLGRGVTKPCARVYRLPTTPSPMPVSSSAEVPATIPPDPIAEGLPHDLRMQWLARATNPGSKGRQQSAATKITKDTDMDTRKRNLAQELLASPEPYSPQPPNRLDIDGHHSLVPSREDLVGFVTTGAFSLSEGRGQAIGSLAVDRVLPGILLDRGEGTLCIVRNAGENVGWIARWEAI